MKQDKTEFIGLTTSLYSINNLIKKASKVDYPILIQGETGVGKELVAKTLFQLSKERKKFVLFNCATIPQNLLESELFGYVKGAFTDAQETRKGIIEEATSGILFFDEISELPVNLQSKILRLIENKEYKKVGDYKIKKCSCRFIFATNKDIKKLILNNKFIPDLYYRISVI
jgi:transcriptional regulator with GAF, ATPase, and Fis domain